MEYSIKTFASLIFKDLARSYIRTRMKKVNLIPIIILSFLLSASTGCLLKEPNMNQPPSPTEFLPDIEVSVDNLTPVMSKGSPSTLNLTIIGINVTSGLPITLDYGIVGWYPDGTSKENPPEISLNFKPKQIVFPKSVNRTEPTNRLYSSLTITAASTSLDGDYFIKIKLHDKKLNISAPTIHLKLGKGGKLPTRNFSTT